MTTLGREIHLMQNPALGAVLLWRFASAYAEAQATHSSVPLPYCSSFYLLYCTDPPQHT